MPFRSATSGAQPPGRAPDDGRGPEEGSPTAPESGNGRQQGAEDSGKLREIPENTGRRLKATESD